MSSVNPNAIIGCLLGMAVGDALGLWCEGLSPGRIHRMQRPLDRYCVLFGRGMVSDDTEHLCLTAQAMITSAGEPDRFVSTLAWRLRWWILGISPGLGKATLQACIKLWLGWSGQTSGVFSAGNGPAMRSPIIGVCFGDDSQHLRKLVHIATCITHTDPKAEYGAMAVALAAHMAAQSIASDELRQVYSKRLANILGAHASELIQLVERAAGSAANGQTPRQFVRELALRRGITGYMYHTVPVVIQAWLRFPDDFRTAMVSIIECGGDTVAAAGILGSIVGARVGKAGIPAEWLRNLFEWPCSIQWLERLGARLAEVCESGHPQRSLGYFIPGLLLRNFVFLAVVFVHAVRRALPPY